MAGNIRTIHAVDVVMPIPLHRSRLHLRGFNQALLLAARIGEAFSMPVCFDNLFRTRPTRPQVELSGPDRVRNVAGAFSLARVDAVKNRSILLIDDVFTTGATINECAKVLKQAGATRVMALTLARAV
jgi:ComF family protein